MTKPSNYLKHKVTLTYKEIDDLTFLLLLASCDDKLKDSCEECKIRISYFHELFKEKRDKIDQG